MRSQCFVDALATLLLCFDQEFLISLRWDVTLSKRSQKVVPYSLLSRARMVTWDDRIVVIDEMVQAKHYAGVSQWLVAVQHISIIIVRFYMLVPSLSVMLNTTL